MHWIFGNTTYHKVISPEGRTELYGKSRNSDGSIERMFVSESGDTTLSQFNPLTGRKETRLSDGTRMLGYFQSKPMRFAGQSFIGIDSLILPSGTVQVLTRSLSIINDSIQTEQTTINGKTWSTITDYKAFTKKIGSPSGMMGFQKLDSAMRVLRDSVSGVNSIAYFYNSFGDVDSIQQVFDSSGLPKISSTRMSYDSVGRISSVTDAKGQNVIRTYNALDQIIQQSLTDSGSMSFKYDKIGNITSIILPNGAIHHFEYDAKNRETIYNAPSAIGVDSIDRKFYDLDENLIRRILPSGDTCPRSNWRHSLSQNKLS